MVRQAHHDIFSILGLFTKPSNIVVLKPEIAAVFPNEAAVNKALKSLIAVAQATAKLTSRSSGRGKKSCAA